MAQYLNLQRITDAALQQNSDADHCAERLAHGETLNLNETNDHRLLKALYVADGGLTRTPGILARGMRKLGLQ